MRGIVIGAQHHRKNLARAVMHIVDEARFRVVAVPITRDRCLLAIGEDEAGDVDRVGAGVLAEFSGRTGTDDRTASGCAEMLDGHDIAAYVAQRRWLHDVLDEHCQIDGKRTGRDEAVAERRGAAGGDALDIVQFAALDEDICGTAVTASAAWQ